MCENIEKCCRICLDMNSNQVSIFGDPTISLHLKSCLTVTITPGDHLPKVICTSCVDQLSQFYNFQLNARCSQDWLESSLQEKYKKGADKITVQPLPDSEYNSDSLLEFLNNTENIEEYLNNLGKEDIPSIVNMFDRNDHTNDSFKNVAKTIKQCSPKKKDKTKNLKMEIDILDSDVEIVKEIIMKETDTKKNKKESLICNACKIKFENIHKLSQHITTCDRYQRSCIQCNILFDSKTKLQQHLKTHNEQYPVICDCGERFNNKETLTRHRQNCHLDQILSMGMGYKCKECSDVFKDRLELYRHAKEHILKSEQKICDVCGHKFIGFDALLKHKKEDHKKLENVAYKCKICNETSKDRTEMYLHVKKHTNQAEPTRHLCESCGRCFATKASLSRHCLQHDIRKIKCRICDVKFNSDKDLDAHVVEHIELVMCDKCGQHVVNCKLRDHKCC